MECASSTEAATALSGGREPHMLRKISVRAKAVSRCACHRSPKQPQQGDIFVEAALEINSSSLRSGICRPDGAGEFGGVGRYKVFVPDGVFGRSATVSAGPVAAGGWAEAVENILWRVFANVLRLIPLCGTQPRSYRNAVAAHSPALTRGDYAGG